LLSVTILIDIGPSLLDNHIAKSSDRGIIARRHGFVNSLYRF
jgi:hypothetical protein